MANVFANKSSFLLYQNLVSVNTNLGGVMSLKEARKKVSGHEWTTSGSYLPQVLLPGTQIPPVQSFVEKECPRCGLRREAGCKEDDKEEGSWGSPLKRALSPIIKQVCW